MTRHGPRTIAAACLLAAAIAVTGCTPPSASPAPTPTGFADEEAAFAAAEETYRAYVDALNRVDLSDPATFEDVYRWTTGDLNASDRESFSAWHANGYSMTGEGVIRSVRLGSVDGSSVSLAACYDVKEVDVTDSQGVSLVPLDREVIQALEIVVDTSEGVISGINPLEGGESC